MSSSLSDFSTCDFCDTHKEVSDGAFRVLPPVFASYGARAKFAGPVSTVKCFEDNSLVKTALDSPGRGGVLVVDGGGSTRRALVVDGCVRDVRELAATEVGIRALASHPMPTTKRSEGLRDVAVQVQGVWVRPGDWLYADEDGIVISSIRLDLVAQDVPPALRESVKRGMDPEILSDDDRL
jgi:regulator of ribonuclease activity A